MSRIKIWDFSGSTYVDMDGCRIVQTPAIARYLNAIVPDEGQVPSDPKAAAKMDMVMSIIDSYGYMAIVAGVVAYQLFPDPSAARTRRCITRALRTARWSSAI